MKIIYYKQLTSLKEKAVQCHYFLHKMVCILKNAFYTDTLEDLDAALKQKITFNTLMQYTFDLKQLQIILKVLEHNFRSTKVGGLDWFCKKVDKKCKAPQVIFLAHQMKTFNDKMR